MQPERIHAQYGWSGLGGHVVAVFESCLRNKSSALSYRANFPGSPMPHLIALLVVVVGPVLLIQHVTGLSFGLAALVAVALVIGGIYALKERAKRKRAERRAALIAKYGSPEEADMILDARIWTA